ncbi:MAG: hypothetical protein HN576_03130 [Bacteriovoracaceae bacterium]|nr:hypothetical protein [Bacteriovoracaceae bacterium]
MENTEDDICVVGIGNVLPDANNSNEFWKNLMNGHSSIRNAPNHRLNSELYYNEKASELTTYTRLAGTIDDEVLKEFAAKNKLNNRPFHRLFLSTLMATREAIEHLEKTLLSSKKTDIYMGAMVADTSLYKKSFLNEKEFYRNELKGKQKTNYYNLIAQYFDYNFGEYSKEDYAYASYTLHMIKHELKINGEIGIFDAACASSLAAIDHAVNKLKSHEADLIITGGMEADITPKAYAAFTCVNGLSRRPAAPFDSTTDGLNLGEGSVVLVLQRLKDAKRNRNHIYGIIKSISSSSDGRSSSLFAPTKNGQVRALTKAYKKLDKSKVRFIECHGTGTTLGDQTELSSTGFVFDKYKIPIGSVKFNIGHTRGAAGAAGVLKSLLIFKNSIVPPSPYFKNYIDKEKSNNLFINKKAYQLEPISSGDLIGVSSFGFGGINYHLTIEAIDDKCLFKPSVKKKIKKIAIIGKETCSTDKDIEKINNWANYNIPPISIKQKQIDISHLKALNTVSLAIKKLGVPISIFNAEKIGVISAIPTTIQTAFNSFKRTSYLEIVHGLTEISSDLKELSNKRWSSFDKITEDTAHGVLNNVIAGRVCNFFNFTGLSLNIDSDLNSTAVAIDYSRHALSNNELDIIFIITADSKYNSKKNKIENSTFYANILCLPSFAQSHGLKITDVLEGIIYGD